MWKFYEKIFYKSLSIYDVFYLFLVVLEKYLKMIYDDVFENEYIQKKNIKRRIFLGVKFFFGVLRKYFSCCHIEICLQI